MYQNLGHLFSKKENKTAIRVWITDGKLGRFYDDEISEWYKFSIVIMFQQFIPLNEKLVARYIGHHNIKRKQGRIIYRYKGLDRFSMKEEIKRLKRVKFKINDNWIKIYDRLLLEEL